MSTGQRSLQAAQKLRLQRTLLGSLTYVFTALVAIGFDVMGVIETSPLIPYVIVILVVNATVLWLLLSGRNLRLRDPSMTAPQVLTGLACNAYIMLHLQDPQARMAFLLLSTMALMFALFIFQLRQVLMLALLMVGMYLTILGTLLVTHPERVHLPIEVVVVFAYTGVMGMISLLGHEMTRLRQKLQERNAQLEMTMRELQQLALHDTLTLLPNRRAIMQELTHKMETALHDRDGESFYVFLLDIDHFKTVNDTHGHNCGDEVLRTLGQEVARSLRHGDFVGRYGGEEFLLAFAPGSSEAARQAAERIRTRVAGLQVSNGQPALRVTASLGGSRHIPGEAIEDTLERADQALYTAKRGGRNRSVMCDQSSVPAVRYPDRRRSKVPH